MPRNSKVAARDHPGRGPGAQDQLGPGSGLDGARGRTALRGWHPARGLDLDRGLHRHLGSRRWDAAAGPAAAIPRAKPDPPGGPGKRAHAHVARLAHPAS
jgi:hypothetical protein